MAGKDALLRDLIEPVVAALGYQLWGVEYLSQGRHAVVRIYIDSDDGIQVDDCAKVSRQVASVFDVEDPIAGEYTLEVSSPGMDRPLFNKAHFESNVGAHVKVKLRAPYEGRRNFAGVLVAVEDEDIVLAIEDHEYLLPLETIDKANVVPQF